MYRAGVQRSHCLSIYIGFCVVSPAQSHRGSHVSCPRTRVVAALTVHVLPWPIKIIGMSATLSNGAELAGWLGATLHVSDFRPIPLDERVLVSLACRKHSVAWHIYRAGGAEIPHPFEQLTPPSVRVCESRQGNQEWCLRSIQYASEARKGNQ